jgi:leader peptidase (prepilin peptidase)/N-methyltransferase
VIISFWSDYLSWALIIVSPFVGSFLGVPIERIPAGRQFLWGRSSCDHCSKELTALDLVPLLSWLASRGRCRYCGTKIGVFYPLIELAALAVAVLSTMLARGWQLVELCILGWVLLALAGIAWQRYRR